MTTDPRLIEELLPGGYAEAASIVRDLARYGPFAPDAFTPGVRQNILAIFNMLATRARTWATEHPESE